MRNGVVTVSGITTTGDEKEVYVTGTTAANKRPLDVTNITAGTGLLSAEGWTLPVIAAAYVAGDTFGQLASSNVPVELTNAMPVAGGSGKITMCKLQHEANTSITNPEFDIILSTTTMTLANDNAAWALSDADSLFVLGRIKIRDAYWYSNTNNSTHTVPEHFLKELPRVQAAAGTRSLFASCQILEGVTVAMSSFKLWLKIE